MPSDEKLPWPRMPAIVQEGDTLECPGCKREITYSEKWGWRDQFDIKVCSPPHSTHGSHLDVIFVREKKA